MIADIYPVGKQNQWRCRFRGHSALRSLGSVKVPPISCKDWSLMASSVYQDGKSHSLISKQTLYDDYGAS